MRLQDDLNLTTLNSLRIKRKELYLSLVIEYFWFMAIENLNFIEQP